jgi:mevalonate kinase
MSDPFKLTARTPAKLIISGEHSVLYGQPALAMAVDRYTQTTTTWHDSPHIYFNLLNLSYAKSFTYNTLQRIRKNLHQDYGNFLNGGCNIRAVLKRPFELLQYSVSNLFDALNIQLLKGVEIAVDSSIPMGCGMGSSAAAIISAIYALTNFLNINWQANDYVNFAKQIENLQHGRSSGLDLHLVTHGGFMRFQDGCAEARPVPQIQMYIINTGAPDSTTGECVTKVAELFKRDPNLALEFGTVTNAIDMAIAQNDIEALKIGIRANHKLLDRIGVVPAKVSKLVAEIEAQNGAAKICGAGAIKGDNAGVVLVLADPDIQHIADKHGYSLQPIQVDTHGTRII